MGEKLDKWTKAMDKLSDAEADIIEAGGWGNKAEADVIRSKGSKDAKGSGKKK